MLSVLTAEWTSVVLDPDDEIIINIRLRKIATRSLGDHVCVDVLSFPL